MRERILPTGLSPAAVPMKTKRKVSTRFVKKALGGAIFLLSATAAPAIDRVWNSGESNNWNDYFNWSPAVPPAPVAPGFSAIFDESTVTEPTLTDTVTIESIIFNAGADIYTIQTNGNVLTLQGAGIVNNSGSLQTIDNDNVEAVGQTIFTNFASAGTVVITNSGEGSSTQFLNNSTAGNATIANDGLNTATGFFDNSTAGNATIANNGANTLTLFFNSSTAGAASIANSGPNTATGFLDNSSAGNATIVNSGQSSGTGFLGNSSAANATITNSGANSFVVFTQGASGGNASLINANPTAFITIAELNGPGTTVGSIAGNGTIFLGSKNLTVGGNQQSSVFSGVISDGEASGLPPAVLTAQSSYVGGSLTKVGAGTLTLAGANTYTGGTTIAGGTILTQNASALGTGPVSFGNGSTLAFKIFSM